MAAEDFSFGDSRSFNFFFSFYFLIGMIAQASDPRLEVRKLLPEKAKNYYA